MPAASSKKSSKKYSQKVEGLRAACFQWKACGRAGALGGIGARQA